MHMHNQDNIHGSVLKGIMLMILAMTIVPIMDGLAKFLSSDYPTTEVVWGRYIFHFFLLLPIVMFKYGPSALLPRHLTLQVIRGGLLVTSTFCFFAARDSKRRARQESKRRHQNVERHKRFKVN